MVFLDLGSFSYLSGADDATVGKRCLHSNYRSTTVRENDLGTGFGTPNLFGFVVERMSAVVVIGDGEGNSVTALPGWQRFNGQ